MYSVYPTLVWVDCVVELIRLIVMCIWLGKRAWFRDGPLEEQCTRCTPHCSGSARSVKSYTLRVGALSQIRVDLA